MDNDEDIFAEFWGHDAMEGSRKFFQILNSCIRDSIVWTCHRYYERQFETAFFEVDPPQTTESCQKIFLKAKL